MKAKLEAIAGGILYAIVTLLSIAFLALPVVALAVSTPGGPPNYGPSQVQLNSRHHETREAVNLLKAEVCEEAVLLGGPC